MALSSSETITFKEWPGQLADEIRCNGPGPWHRERRQEDRQGQDGRRLEITRGSGADLLVEDRVGLDLDQHRRVHETADPDHRAGGPDLVEHLAVRAADLLPV